MQTESVTLSFTFSGSLTGDAKNKYPLSLSIFFRIYNGADYADEATASFDLSGNPVILTKTPFLTLARNDFNNQKITFDTDLALGQKVQVYYSYAGGDRKNTILQLNSGAIFSVKAKNQQVLYTQTIQCERIFPDVSQKDLLKDTLQRFGIICQTDTNNKTINFSSLKQIVNNIPNAKDWTQKVVNQGKQVNYQLGNYSQKNWLRYKFDEGVPIDVMPQYFADDFIIIHDKTINPGTPEQDLFVSIFAPSPNRPYYGGTIAQILKIDTSTDANAVDFTISTEPRLLVDNKYSLLGTGKTVMLTDGNGNNRVINDTISTPYFYKPDGNFNLCWNDKALPGLRSTYYPELQKVLQQTKKIVRYVMLTPRDITQLDLLTPIYLQQDGAYFYINKVDSWLKGRPCKVELVRLG